MYQCISVGSIVQLSLFDWCIRKIQWVYVKSKGNRKSKYSHTHKHIFTSMFSEQKCIKYQLSIRHYFRQDASTY